MDARSWTRSGRASTPATTDGSVGFAERHVLGSSVVTVVLLVLGGAALGGAGGSVAVRLVQAALGSIGGGG